MWKDATSRYIWKQPEVCKYRVQRHTMNCIMSAMKIAETWKPVPGYEGLYAVSSLGKVVRIKQYNNSSHRPLAESIVCGYPRLSLSKNGKVTSLLVHRLVAGAFLDLKQGLVVNHLNGIKTDCRLENLEVCTYQQNERHKWDVLKKGHYSFAKLSFQIAQNIRRETLDGATLTELSNKYSVTKGTIIFIRKRETWKTP